MDNETNENTEQIETQTDESGAQDETDELQIDSDKAVEKLKARLGRETANKHELETQLADAQKQLAELQKGKKGVKELSDTDKAEQAEKAKDKEIADLKAQIARSKTLDDTRAVFKESGVSEYLNDEALNMVVTNDDDSTFKNVQAVSSVIQAAYDAGKKFGLRGETPKEKGKQTSGAITKAQFDMMNVSERVKALDADPNLTSKF